MTDTSSCQCRQDRSHLDALRVWAWDRGRTDIIWDLDLHAQCWAVWEAPTRDNLTRLAALLPVREVDAQLRSNIEQLATGGADVARSGRPAWLERWCRERCSEVIVDLAEMTAGRRPETGLS